MWRARSDGDDRPLHNDDNRVGSGGASLSGSAGPPGAGSGRDRPAQGSGSSRDRAAQASGSGPDRAAQGPGSSRDRAAQASGSGRDRAAKGSGSGRDRAAQVSGPSLARRQTGRTPAEGGGGGSEQDPASPGRRSRNVRPEQPATGDAPSFGAAPGGLPPLRQPTGEVPVVAATDEGDGTDSPANDDSATGDLSDWPTDLPANGVFDRPGAAETEIDLTTVAASAADDDADNGAPETGEARSIAGAMPSALSAAGTARPSSRGGRSGATTAFGGRPDGQRSPEGAGMPSAFPDSEGRPADPPFPSWTAGKTDPGTSIDETLAMGPMAVGRSARPGGQGSMDRRPPSGGAGAGAGGGGGGGRPGSRPSGSQRLQETEIKLAGRQAAPTKPREPNRLLLGLALALVVLAGAAVAWWMTRDDGTTDQVAQADQEQDAQTDTSLDTEGAAPEPEAPAADEPILDVPTLSLLDVAPGPLDSAATYSLELFGESPGSLLQVVVDDVPQGQPDAVLPDLILPAGRHTLVVNVTDAAGIKTSSPVEVYVLDAPPAAGYMANLASVDMVNEGWDEAIRRFDGFRDAGHQDVRLLPITPGFWNIFVPELGDAEGASAYCESFGQAMPDECFTRDFDPATYQVPAPAAPADSEGDDAVTDQDDGATTDEGEADTSTSTTTGG